MTQRQHDPAYAQLASTEAHAIHRPDATEAAVETKPLRVCDTVAGMASSSAQMARLDAALIQFRRSAIRRQTSEEARAIAMQPLGGSSTALPHLDRIQTAFGHHDVSGVRAYRGPAANTAASALGASAYATGDSVVLSDSADLHTVSHEAAHVIQQRSGIALKDGLGRAGDRYEQHADRVADAVVAGRSAVPLLDAMVGAGRHAPATGTTIQLHPGDDAEEEEEEFDTRHGASPPFGAADRVWNEWLENNEDYESDDRRVIARRERWENSGGFQSPDEAGSGARRREGNRSSRDASVGLDGARLRAANDQQQTNEDGSRDRRSRNAQLDVDREGNVNVRGGLSNETRDANGGTTGNAANARVNLRERSGSASVSRENTGRDGQSDTSYGASVNGRVSDRGQLDEMGGEVEASVDGTKLVVTRSHQITMTRPARAADGRRWVVVCTCVDRRSLGASRGEGPTATRRSGSSGAVTASEARTVTIRRHFPNRQRAMRFYNTADSSDFENARELQVDDVQDMQEGDSVSDQEDQRIRLEGSTTVLGVEFGASFECGPTRSIQVTRLEGNRVRVAVSEGNVNRLGAHMRALIGLGRSYNSSHTVRLTYVIDISTPAGERAFCALRDDQPVPEQGATLTEHRVIDTEGDGTTAGPISLTDTETEETVTTAEGQSRIHTGTHGVSGQMPVLGDEDSHQTSVQITDPAQGDAEYEFRDRINSGNAAETRRLMDRATGLNNEQNGDDDVEGESSGNWTLSRTISENQISLFARAVVSGLRPEGAHGWVEGEYQQLRQSLLRSPRGTARHRAIRRFIAETGSRGTSIIRNVLAVRGQTEQYDVSLEGSDTFTGRAGREQVEARINAWSNELEEEPARVLREASAELRTQRTRLRDMNNPDRYRELRAELRQQQVQVVQGFVQQLERIVSRSRRLAQQMRRDNPDAAPEQVATDSADGDTVDRASRSERRAAAEENRQMAQSREALGEGPELSNDEATEMIRSEVASTWSQVEQLRREATRAQQEAQTDRDAHRRARNSMGDEGSVFGLIGRGSHYEQYQRADNAYGAGQRAMEQGMPLYDRLDSLHSQFDTSRELSERQVHLYRLFRVRAQEVQRHLREATSQYRRAHHAYGTIWATASRSQRERLFPQDYQGEERY